MATEVGYRLIFTPNRARRASGDNACRSGLQLVGDAVNLQYALTGDADDEDVNVVVTVGWHALTNVEVQQVQIQVVAARRPDWTRSGCRDEALQEVDDLDGIWSS